MKGSQLSASGGCRVLLESRLKCLHTRRTGTRSALFRAWSMQNWHHKGVAVNALRGLKGVVVGSALFAVWMVAPITAAQAAPSVVFPLIVEPSAGPIGSVVTITLTESALTQNLGGCGSIVFESANGAGPVTVAGTFLPVNGVTHQSVMVPNFDGSGQPVAPGRYQFAVSCRTGTGLTPIVTIVAPFEVTTPIATGTFVGMATTPDGHGYWLAQAGGGVYSYGDALFHGSLPGIGVVPHTLIVGMATTPDGGGYWLVGADGGVFAFGDARFHGSLAALGVTPALPVVGIVVTTDGGGYWLVGGDGGEFAFGDARVLREHVRCPSRRYRPSIPTRICQRPGTSRRGLCEPWLPRLDRL